MHVSWVKQDSLKAAYKLPKQTSNNCSSCKETLTFVSFASCDPVLFIFHYYKLFIFLVTVQMSHMKYMHSTGPEVITGWSGWRLAWARNLLSHFLHEIVNRWGPPRLAYVCGGGDFLPLTSLSAVIASLLHLLAEFLATWFMQWWWFPWLLQLTCLSSSLGSSSCFCLCAGSTAIYPSLKIWQQGLLPTHLQCYHYLSNSCGTSYFSSPVYLLKMAVKILQCGIMKSQSLH